VSRADRKAAREKAKREALSPDQKKPEPEPSKNNSVAALVLLVTMLTIILVLVVLLASSGISDIATGLVTHTIPFHGNARWHTRTTYVYYESEPALFYWLMLLNILMVLVATWLMYWLAIPLLGFMKLGLSKLGSILYSLSPHRPSTSSGRTDEGETVQKNKSKIP
jgi:small-conductance mechanosensitive channel